MNTATAHWTSALADMNACGQAVTFAEGYPTFLAAWKACERADWLLWILGKTCGTRAAHHALVATAYYCARSPRVAVFLLPEEHRAMCVLIRARHTCPVLPEPGTADGSGSWTANLLLDLASRARPVPEPLTASRNVS